MKQPGFLFSAQKSSDDQYTVKIFAEYKREKGDSGVETLMEAEEIPLCVRNDTGKSVVGMTRNREFGERWSRD